MQRPMKLRGRIYLENNRKLTFHCTTFDSAPFDLSVDQFDVELNEPFTPKNRWVDGWLLVHAEAQQNNIVYLTLPKPSIVHGHQISVNDIQLMPREASIADFKKPGLSGQTVPAPKDDVVVPEVEETVKALEEDPFGDLPEDEPINLNECQSGKCCG